MAAKTTNAITPAFIILNKPWKIGIAWNISLPALTPTNVVKAATTGKAFSKADAMPSTLTLLLSILSINLVKPSLIAIIGFDNFVKTFSTASRTFAKVPVPFAAWVNLA